MITIVLVGRNDDYGKNFRERLFRATDHNASVLSAAGIEFEFLFVEYNPLPGRDPLSEEFLGRVPRSRALILPGELHAAYTLNPGMPFHEMPAKNAGIRRARGDRVAVINADILFGASVVHRMADTPLERNTLYRAHRIDVPNDLPFERMKDPAHHLLSGEGRLPPCYYLGAGGDFCMARKSLWETLRGFDERVRFTTRAKDWQFFLSAAARGVSIEFVGDVYHLDHEGGFRNTPRESLESAGVHFGGMWDIEFGLPVENPADWGFVGLPERAWRGMPGITVLDPAGYAFNQSSHESDLRLKDWLTAPPGAPDTASAAMMHAICAAFLEARRLVFRSPDPRDHLALSGFQAVAAEFAVPVFCNWTWPDIPGRNVRPFVPEPADLGEDDWVLSRQEKGFRLRPAVGAGEKEFLPRVRPVRDPAFNPVLARRLLRAYLRLLREHVGPIALYGAGSHTAELLKWGVPDALSVAAVAVTEGAGGLLDGLPVRRINDLHGAGTEAVLLSSSSFEPEMMDLAHKAGIARVVPLYGDWPRDYWSPRAGLP